MRARVPIVVLILFVAGACSVGPESTPEGVSVLEEADNSGDPGPPLKYHSKPQPGAPVALGCNAEDEILDVSVYGVYPTLAACQEDVARRKKKLKHWAKSFCENPANFVCTTPGCKKKVVDESEIPGVPLDSCYLVKGQWYGESAYSKLPAPPAPRDYGWRAFCRCEGSGDTSSDSSSSATSGVGGSSASSGGAGGANGGSDVGGFGAGSTSSAVGSGGAAASSSSTGISYSAGSGAAGGAGGGGGAPLFGSCFDADGLDPSIGGFLLFYPDDDTGLCQGAAGIVHDQCESGTFYEAICETSTGEADPLVCVQASPTYAFPVPCTSWCEGLFGPNSGVYGYCVHDENTGHCECGFPPL